MGEWRNLLGGDASRKIDKRHETKPIQEFGKLVKALWDSWPHLLKNSIYISRGKKVTKKDQERSMFITAYEGEKTADEVYNVLRAMEKNGDLDIRTAATVHRKDNGKLKVSHKRRVTVTKGAAGGAVLGLVLAGTGVGLLAGAVVGSIVGSSRHGDRQDLKEFLDDKLGPDDSALAIVVNSADYAAVLPSVEQYGGEELDMRLTPDAEAQLQAIATDPQVAAAVAETVEIEEVDAD